MGEIDNIEELLKKVTEQSERLSVVLTALDRLNEQLDAAMEIALTLQRDTAVEYSWRVLVPPADIDKPDDTKGGA